MAADWDVLIILDACRHDYFAEAYGDFFRGKLEQRISLGSSTPEWRIKTFKKTYNDIVYISANPYINSRTKIFEDNARDLDELYDRASEELRNMITNKNEIYAELGAEKIKKGKK